MDGEMDQFYAMDMSCLSGKYYIKDLLFPRNACFQLDFVEFQVAKALATYSRVPNSRACSLIISLTFFQPARSYYELLAY